MERWVLLRKGADFEAIGKKYQISPRLACLIRNRDVIGEEAVDRYLNGTISDLYDGMLMKDMDKAIDILKEKILEDKKIRVIGDYDIDGVNATYILLEGLELLEPFGKGNTKPVFAARDVTLLGARILGKNRNVLKLQVQDVNGCRIEAMLFHHADDFLSKLEEQYGKTEVDALLKGRGRQIRISMTYYPDINEYMGKKTPQIVVTHYR